MAKKVVATLKKKVAKFAKVIKAIKNPETGAYTFKEEIVKLTEVQDAIKA